MAMSAARTHHGERFMAGRVNERDAAAFLFHLIRADVLGDAAGFRFHHVRFANRVQRFRLAVIHMPHHHNHRRTRDERVRFFFLNHLLDAIRGLHDFRAVSLFGLFRFRAIAEFLGDDRRGRIVNAFVLRREDAGFHQFLNHARNRQTKDAGKVAHRQHGGQDHLARRAGLAVARAHHGRAQQLFAHAFLALMFQPLAVNLVRDAVVHFDGARADIKTQRRQFGEKFLRSNAQPPREFRHIHVRRG